MATAHEPTSEVAIFGRILESDQPGVDAAAARAILGLDFKQSDKERMRELLAKSKAGTLSDDETAEIENYDRVGHMLSLMKTKARDSLSIKETGDSLRAH